MTRVVFNLHSPRERRRAADFLANAPPESTVEFKRDRRSGAQNRRMWAALTDIAQQVEWYGQKLTSEDWKDVLSASLRRARVVPGVDPGSFVPLGMRTSDMTVAEMGELLELITAFGVQQGVRFHDGFHDGQGGSGAKNPRSEAA